MATTPPPEPPTQPLRPPRRRAPIVQEPVAPIVEERAVAPVVDANVLLLRVEDAIDGLRTWLAVVGLIAVAALGVGLYALLSNDSSSRSATTSRSGLASDDRVSQLDNRVDDLSRQLQSLRAGSAPRSAALDDRIAQLESTVKTLSGRPASSDPQQAIDELSGRIDDLTKDVETLKQAPASP